MFDFFAVSTFFQSSNGFGLKLFIVLKYDLRLVFDRLFSLLFQINRWRARRLGIDFQASCTNRFEVLYIFPRLSALGWSVQESLQTWKLLQLQIFPFFWPQWRTKDVVEGWERVFILHLSVVYRICDWRQTVQIAWKVSWSFKILLGLAVDKNILLFHLAGL